MKKVLGLLLVMTIFSLGLFAQRTTRVTIAEGKVPASKLTWSVIESNGDTYCYIGWQNFQYQHITDIGSAMFTKTEDFNKFLDLLEEFANTENGVEVSEGRLSLHKFTKSIMIKDLRADNYQYITKRNALKLVIKLRPYADQLNMK